MLFELLSLPEAAAGAAPSLVGDALALPPPPSFGEADSGGGPPPPGPPA